MIRPIIVALAACAITCAASAEEITSSVNSDQIAERKRTNLGLYLTPAEAAAALQGDPSVVFIDVRDPIEVMFVGHPDPVDAVIPFGLVTHRFNPERGAYTMTPNPSFIENVAALMAREGKDPSDPVFVTCLAGGRTARAVNALADAGFSQVYALFEGVEGDRNPETGQRDVNGWKNAGLPWSYKLTPAQAWQPSE